ncbi:hypothetical protein D3C87_1338060 [compost metagenome]
MGLIGGFGNPGGEASDRQVEGELDPVFYQIHPLFVAARELVVVVAFQQRTHGQQILDRDRGLARVGIVEWPIGRNEGHDRGVHVDDVAFADGRAHQHGGHGLGGGAGVAARLDGAVVEIDFMNQASVTCDQHAGDLLEGPGAHGGVHGGEPFGRKALGFRGRCAPGCLGGGWRSDGEQGGDEQTIHGDLLKARCVARRSSAVLNR